MSTYDKCLVYHSHMHMEIQVIWQLIDQKMYTSECLCGFIFAVIAVDIIYIFDHQALCVSKGAIPVNKKDQDVAVRIGWSFWLNFYTLNHPPILTNEHSKITWSRLSFSAVIFMGWLVCEIDLKISLLSYFRGHLYIGIYTVWSKSMCVISLFQNPNYMSNPM